MGHINAITTVQARLNLDRIIVVPAAQSPHKPPVEGPSNEHRLGMLRQGLAEFPFIEIDEQEMSRGGFSYSVDTIAHYAQNTAPENLFLIVGLDQFEEFDRWKDFERILTMANLIVVTRPNHSVPFSEEDMPKGLRALVGAFDRQYVALNTGRFIEFVRRQDVDEQTR